MLSKQQAKVFFLGGTFFFLAIFVAMSIHSLIVGIPQNTNANDLTPQVKLGKKLWDDNNCMGCHTIMGEGAYYAPELTRVYSRKGPEYIRTVLNAPNGWGPRGRRMVKYEFTDEEVEGLVGFFEWMNRAELNGFPPEPSLEK
ncbi:c-type cytochrome [Reichenbachiella sp.]|uniref:c-type cytochrome n=1 Tax=Reichenbachiella sp. TaxID=2184521 RepID=UPI003B5AE8D0